MAKQRHRRRRPGPRALSRILKVCRELDRPVSLKELTELLDLDAEHAKALPDSLAQLIQSGELVRLEGGLYGLTAAMNLVAGELVVHPDGFGFVIPDDGKNDIFINPRNLKEALHGDRVVVRVEHVGRRGRREGRIIRLLERRVNTVVGILQESEGTCFVVPEEERLLFDLIIPAEDLSGAQVGEVVRAAIVRQPSGRLNPIGRVLEVLGPPEDPAVQAQILVYKYDLPDRFPADVLDEAQAAPPEVREADHAGRLDLRDLPIVTIDGVTARDFDDGVALAKKPGGGFVLHVAIADVDHYVPTGSALDTEAYRRGTSIYFPQRVLPMLPHELSNGICSLKPQVERLAVTVTLEFDRHGRRRAHSFARSVIKSQARLTYDEVQHLLDGGRPAILRGRPHLAKMLRQMGELCLLLRQRRRERGSLLLTIPEAEVVLDDRGVPVNIRRLDHLLSHQIIEEFMIAANEAIAEHLGDPMIFRVHDVPDREKLTAFRDLLKKLGYELPAAAAHDPQVMSDFFDTLRDSPLAFMVQVMLLRSLKQAVYTTHNRGHYGLAASFYTHFTSPIRRYPDLMVHRILLARLTRRPAPIPADPEELEEQAHFQSVRERVAVEAEREMLARMQVRCLAEHVGEYFHGTITGVTAFGFFVGLEEIYAEGLVRLVDLPTDYYRYQESRLRLVGTRTGTTYQVGDAVKVQVARVDMRRRHINLALADTPAAAGEGQTGGAAATKPRRPRRKKPPRA